MRSTLIAAGAASVLASWAGIASADVVETRDLDETVPVAAGQPLVVIVRNITGSVHVTEHDRDRVEMHAVETIRGDLQADIERARAELQLRTESEPGRVAFRIRNLGGEGNWGGNNGWGDDYVVEYEIEVRVPRGATVEAGTVNEGDVTVEGLSGDFRLSNVNGAVRLTGATGNGEIKTVNGNVNASFARVPTEGSSFHTVNGDLDVTFPNELAADLELKTMNGDVYTDFEVVSLAQPATVERSFNNRGNGMRSMARMNRNSAFRVGNGGEMHSFNTLNGDIYVRKASR